MKTRLIVCGCTLAIVIGVVLTYRSITTSPRARSIALFVTGPEGQQFTGSYIADGVQHTVSAIAPTKIYLRARTISYLFGREDRTGEFCVSLYADSACKTSVTNSTGMGIAGQWVSADPVDRYSARPFSELNELNLPNQIR